MLYDAEIEYKALCSILTELPIEDGVPHNSNETFGEFVANGVTTETFFDAQYSAIFQAMDELYEEGESINPDSVSRILAEHKLLDLVGGEEAIRLMEDIPLIVSRSYIAYDAKHLRDYEMCRRVRLLGEQLQNLALQPGEKGSNLYELLKTGIESIDDDFRPERQGLTERMKEFIALATGDFNMNDMVKYLEMSTKFNGKTVLAALHRLLKEDVIIRVGNRHGVFRRVEADCPTITMDGVTEEIYPMLWPLNLEEYIQIMPKNIAIIAGQSNAGKSIFLLNTAKLNMATHEVHYFSSEMGDRELKKNLRRFNDLLPEHWTVKFHERSSNFADVIRPDAMNIIDFLEVTDDFFLIGKHIKEIFDKLQKGIAIIAIQKDPHKELGRGSSMSIEKARLYLTLDFDTANRRTTFRIKKAKLWATDTNPNGMELSARLTSGMQYEYTPWGLPVVSEPKPKSSRRDYHDTERD